MPTRALASVLLLSALACRPDPYDLLLRTIEPGEEVELPDGTTLVAGAREGAVLYDVRITGRAPTCDGTMVLDAREVRIERAAEGANLVLLDATAEERCGPLTSTTTHASLALHLDRLAE